MPKESGRRITLGGIEGRRLEWRRVSIKDRFLYDPREPILPYANPLNDIPYCFDQSLESFYVQKTEQALIMDVTRSCLLELSFSLETVSGYYCLDRGAMDEPDMRRD